MNAGSTRMSLVIRVFIGLLAAGLTPGIIAAILYFASSSQVAFIYSGVITVFIISLLHVGVLGVPAFLVGWYFNRIRPWSILFISFVIGALPTAVALRLLMPGNLSATAGNTVTWVNGTPTFAGVMVNLEIITMMGLCGLSGGIVFLIIWRFWIYPAARHVRRLP